MMSYNIWDFEDGTMGSWSNAADGTSYRWNIIQARNSASDTEDTNYDHTTMTDSGYFAEISSKSGQVGNRAALRSPSMNKQPNLNPTFCLSLWFWKGEGDDLLEIVQEGNQLTQVKIFMSNSLINCFPLENSLVIKSI